MIPRQGCAESCRRRMAQTSSASGTNASSHQGRMKWKSPFMPRLSQSSPSLLLVLVLDHLHSRTMDEHGHEDDVEIIEACAGILTRADPAQEATKRYRAADDGLPFRPCVSPTYRASRISR